MLQGSRDFGFGDSGTRFFFFFLGGGGSTVDDINPA